MTNAVSFQSPKTSYPRLISQSEVEAFRKGLIAQGMSEDLQEQMMHLFLSSVRIEQVNPGRWSKMHTAVLLEKIKSIRKPGGRPWPTMICYFEMIAACEQAEHTRHAPPSVVPLSRAELAERMGCSKQRITQYMQALEEVGLVERELLPKGRGVIYHVNPLVSTWGRPDSVTAQVVEFEHLQRTNAKKRETQMELV